jgi:hypothetical protein
MAISNNSTGLRPGVCTSTTRPTAPYEGQMIYETDTDMVAIWNGSAWRYLAATTPTNGTVLQVVNATTTTMTVNSTGTYVSTGLSGSITPKSASSKILVNISQSMYNYAAGGGFAAMTVRLVRGASTTLQTFIDAGFTRAYVSPSGVDNVHQFSINFLDSPSTTSSVSYRTDFIKAFGDSVYAQVNNNPGSITLMEIAG